MWHGISLNVLWLRILLIVQVINYLPLGAESLDSWDHGISTLHPVEIDDNTSIPLKHKVSQYICYHMAINPHQTCQSTFHTNDFQNITVNPNSPIASPHGWNIQNTALVKLNAPIKCMFHYSLAKSNRIY